MKICQHAACWVMCDPAGHGGPLSFVLSMVSVHCGKELQWWPGARGSPDHGVCSLREGATMVARGKRIT